VITLPDIKIISIKTVTKPNRQVQVKLSTKSIIKIERCQESWEQWGGTTEELWQTVDIADKYNDWLHGGELPI
jgi:hypothetical protein